jgi:hypothetical protein
MTEETRQRAEVAVGPGMNRGLPRENRTIIHEGSSVERRSLPTTMRFVPIDGVLRERDMCHNSRVERQWSEFDISALFMALDDQRVARGLSWRCLADEMWNQSDELNAQRQDHPISPATLSNMQRRGNISCQHALFMLRWLDRSPESFLTEGAGDANFALPEPGRDHRLRWNLKFLYQGLDERRHEQDLTWSALAQELRCTTNQLTGIRTARYAIEMKLAMRIVQWLNRPAADFIYAARW